MIKDLLEDDVLKSHSTPIALNQKEDLDENLSEGDITFMKSLWVGRFAGFGGGSKKNGDANTRRDRQTNNKASTRKDSQLTIHRMSMAVACTIPPPPCGATLATTATWTTRKVTVGDPAITKNSNAYKMCTDWIRAPAGKIVQIRVTELQGVNCIRGCWVHAIEPKIDSDKKLTNARYCCPADLKRILPSRINPTPVVSYSIRRAATFTYQYRHV
ncbi:hypothetical protein TELCIR_09010 [Teladorsagia circumcincta]|uniref:Uncharacterized protein n=1 Tax=Teladorsagia circumcincta TaxID=45464 RepID=A0A2G9UG08_TELCI|nr:hypothetical protein TELCIR_09010 [Teladorsagia circumcincta]